MSAEEFRADVERALQSAVADDVSPDDLSNVLEDMQQRIDRLRIVQGGGA